MMKLSEIRDAYEEISGKLSDINRQLCFAGFAIIWILIRQITIFPYLLNYIYQHYYCALHYF